jgi:hypothetical protein
MVRNLARQPEKESATSLIEKAANLRRGTVREVQKTLEPMERRAAADVPATNLVGRFFTRRLTRQLEDRLPGLSASLRRQGERVAQLARASGLMAERLIAATRRHTSGLQTDGDYWRRFRDTTPEPKQTPDQTQKRGRAR